MLSIFQELSFYFSQYLDQGGVIIPDRTRPVTLVHPHCGVASHIHIQHLMWPSQPERGLAGGFGPILQIGKLKFAEM